MSASSAGSGASGGRLRGRWLAAARAVWVAAAAPVVALFIFGLPAYYEQFRTLSVIGDLAYREMARENLAQLGLSPEFYAGYYVALGVALAAACFAVAAGLFARRSGEPVALFVALTLVLLGTTFTGSTGTLTEIGPLWGRLGEVLETLSLASVFLFFFLFPDGRFTPRWTRWLAAAYVAYAGAALFSGSLIGSEEGPVLPYALALAALLVFGLAAQIYRYRRVSGPVERQQTKWVVFGFAAALAGQAGIVSLQAFVPSLEPGTLAELTGAGAACGFMLLIPLSLGVAVLRHRLWDIDVVINRTLVYGTLSVLLALVYSGGVFGLQSVFRALSGQDSQAAVVVSTLAVAALFVPLRRRTQATIDRRFYRHKYDAEKTLRRFAATLRQEVEPGSLERDLVSVVSETVQPEHVSLWLRKSGKSR